MNGTVFDIKEFSIYDGPGVRVTVFLKGCPLRCKWCHNPEGLSPFPQVMLSKNMCTSCGKCFVADCPLTGSVAAFESGKATCTGCGKCVGKCPMGLRKMSGTSYTPDELVKRILRYEVFFRDGGGVTFSGGEPTMQHEFLIEVLDKLNIHKAIQTCGYCEPEIFKKIISKLDFVFFDIKHAFSDEHKLYTGVGNEKILKNLEYLKTTSVPFVVRIPLIQGVNDSKENLEKTASLVQGAKNLLRVEILPYNESAGAKYEMVGKDYPHKFKAPENIDTTPFTKLGIECKIM
jgi:pyruvate formate lyase activating enzyme